MFDLQGPKLRLSSDTEQRRLEVGDTVTFAGSDVAARPTTSRVDFAGFSDLVTERSEIVIGDGVPRMVSERVEDGVVATRRRLARRRSARARASPSPTPGPTLPAITEKDLEDLDIAVEMEADFVALSFVRSGADMQALRDLLDERGSRRPDDREGREGRGLRAPRRGHRRVRRHHGRPRRLRRRGGRRARAAHAEGHDRPRDAGGQARHHRDAHARVDGRPRPSRPAPRPPTSPTRSSTAPRR